MPSPRFDAATLMLHIDIIDYSPLYADIDIDFADDFRLFRYAIRLIFHAFAIRCLAARC
jgi:hypothetical protein